MSHPAEDLYTAMREAAGQRVFGMQDAVHDLCVALLCHGHVLIEGVPGLGKTLLARTIARVLGGDFERIQGTYDLMPSDITGVHIYNTQQGNFEFTPGPLFADVLLFDEINRTGPKTQSALLEAMEERTVTMGRETRELPADFFVLASQNPHEFEGTYPLPESQLDRFLLRLQLGYPGKDDELAVLDAYDRPETQQHSQPVPTIADGQLKAARQQMASLHVAKAIHEYAYRLAQASRSDSRISLGLSTRGMLALVRAARASAALRGGDYVTPEDVKRVAPGVIAHRLVLTPESQIEGLTDSDITHELLDQVEIPR